MSDFNKLHTARLNARATLPHFVALGESQNIIQTKLL